MVVIGIGVGFLFAVVVLTISVVSFPMLLDRPVGVGAAINTSVRAVLANPAAMAAWGFVVAFGLVLGSIPAFLGLIVVLPVLGHATWHHALIELRPEIDRLGSVLLSIVVAPCDITRAPVQIGRAHV